MNVVIIGGGPGGYDAAIRCAQLGANVTVIEKEHLGGTCLNVGCIPTKAILHAAEAARIAKESAGYGVHISNVKIDWKEVVAFKSSITEKLVNGVRALLKVGKIQVIEGTAKFIHSKTLEVTLTDDKKQIIEADKIIIATGSVPVMPPIPGLKESKYVIDSTGALTMETLPKSMIIIGGGVIGVEFACALEALGCHIIIVEALPKLVPTLDDEMSMHLVESLKKQGIELMMEHKVVEVVDEKNGARLVLDNKGNKVEVSASVVLCAVGRRPYIDGLELDNAGIKYEKTKVLVNDYLETNVSGVYAIGDCVGKVMLAHTAYAMGEIAAENIFGKKEVYNPTCIPSGIYAFPEMASVGMTEEEVKAKGIKYHIGKFPLSGNGRALIANGGEGLVKIIIGDELDEVLGLHILAPNAMEMLGEGAVAINMEATVDEIINTIHSHPTVTEAIREAALAAEGRAIHMPNKKKG